ncbi:hypothetical protein CTEN210_18592 [Chaetoceros tenuissimus]|uniref:Reverse transcriptase Ty1/copia-type domain-containing protein n=1 Tax=Chaetoceros tenuissimus TaxID=426638 RepID=A0AAD3HG62_9STRA|nr:hypothetical protein CTEN210_18592 [Chaetoceros tenuissimus]
MRRNQTGLILYLNSDQIIWNLKRQATVNSRSEFVALGIASELIISMRYKLRMMGVPIEGPTHVFCDNKAVYKNSSDNLSDILTKSLSAHIRKRLRSLIMYIRN